MAPPSEQDEHSVGRAADPRWAGAAATVLELVVGAEWVAPSIVRRRIGRWLRDLQWAPAQIDELVLAASEAVSNSVEHGYLVSPDAVGHPGIVVVRGRILVETDGYRCAEIVVRDEGRWREPTPGVSSRGHGMLLMRTCSDRFGIEHGPGGTTVVLVGRPTPPPLRP